MIRRATLLVLVALYASVASAFVAPRPVAAVSIQSYTLFTAQLPFSQERQHEWSLQMSTDQEGEKKSNLPFLLDPGTKGGAVFLSLILFIVPLIGYSVVTNVFGYDPTEAGIWIGVGFTVLSTFLWVGTYIFRVATKDMTYVSLMGYWWLESTVNSLLKLFPFENFLHILTCDGSCIYYSFLQAKQLKDYENAVIAKRLEELDDDEIQALVEEIDRDDF